MATYRMVLTWSRLSTGIVVAIWLSATLALYIALHESETAKTRAAFSSVIDARTSLLARTTHQAVEDVQALANFLQVSGLRDPAHFDRYARRELASEPLMTLFGWAPRMDQSQREHFEASAGLTLRQLRSCRPDRQDSEYLPITLISGNSRFDDLKGIDLAAETDVARLLPHAGQQGTAHLMLAELTEEAVKGLLIFVPVYPEGDHPEQSASGTRSPPAGFAFGWLQSDTLMEYSRPPSTSDWSVLSVFDAADQVLASEAAEFGVGDHGRIEAERKIELAEHVWTLRYVSTPAFTEQHKTGAPWIALLVGFAMALIFGSFTSVLLRRQRQVVRNVAERIEAQQAAEQNIQALSLSKERIKTIVRTMADGVMHIDQKGVILMVNDAILSQFGYSEAELVKRTSPF